MTRLVFGVDEPPKDKGDPMAYVARAGCGHIVIVQADTRASSLGDFLAMGVAGLTVERVPAQMFRDEGLCPCPGNVSRKKPVQIGAFG